MQEWIQRIAVYVVLITVLRSLVSRPQYQQYFRFVSGLILILLLILPVLRILDGDTGLYEMVNRSLFEQEREDVESSLRLAQGEMETMIREEYQRLIQSQVTELAQKHQFSIQEVSVTLDEQDQLTGLEIHLASGAESPAKAELHVFRKEIEQYYQLGEECVVIWI